MFNMRERKTDRILGIPSADTDVRVLPEALAKIAKARLKTETETLEAVRQLAFREGRQHLKAASVGSTIHLDGGNGCFAAERQGRAWAV